MRLGVIERRASHDFRVECMLWAVLHSTRRGNAGRVARNMCAGTEQAMR